MVELEQPSLMASIYLLRRSAAVAGGQPRVA